MVDRRRRVELLELVDRELPCFHEEHEREERVLVRPVVVKRHAWERHAVSYVPRRGLLPREGGSEFIHVLYEHVNWFLRRTVSRLHLADRIGAVEWNVLGSVQAAKKNGRLRPVGDDDIVLTADVPSAIDDVPMPDIVLKAQSPLEEYPYSNLDLIARRPNIHRAVDELSSPPRSSNLCSIHLYELEKFESCPCCHCVSQHISDDARRSIRAAAQPVVAANKRVGRFAPSRSPLNASIAGRKKRRACARIHE